MHNLQSILTIQFLSRGQLLWDSKGLRQWDSKDLLLWDNNDQHQ